MLSDEDRAVFAEAATAVASINPEVGRLLGLPLIDAIVEAIEAVLERERHNQLPDTIDTGAVSHRVIDNGQ